VPKVWNRRDPNCPKGPNVSYVGRPSKYGNPFPIGKSGDRAKVIELYGKWLASSGITIEEIKRDLRGKDLVCWCAPEACHADVLLEIANSDAN